MATITPMSREVRVPAQTRAHRSWPMLLVPNQNPVSEGREQTLVSPVVTARPVASSSSFTSFFSTYTGSPLLVMSAAEAYRLIL